MSGGGWIGVDLDGTLAKYDRWRGAEHIGDPIPLMVARVQDWIAKGREVRIFTARMGDQATADVSRPAIEAWCREHIGRALPVTNVKDMAMAELWDDRAVQVEPNTGIILGRSTRGLW
jgi:hypothetical protein